MTGYSLIPLLALVSGIGLYDAWRHEISNWAVVVLLVLVFFIKTETTPAQQIVEDFGLGLFALFICVWLFAFNIFGGGDGKLLPVLVFYFGDEYFYEFMLTTSLWLGGLILLSYITSIGWDTIKRTGFPCGLAMAFSTSWVLLN